METIQVVVGSGIVIINLLPFLMKKPKYLFLTSVLSVLMAFLLVAIQK